MSFKNEVELARQHAPAAAAIMTQLVVDNPGQFALIAAGSIVLGRAALNIVRPRGPLEALALLAVIEFAAPLLVRQAIDRGILRFRVRNADGELVPLVPGDAAGA